MAKTKILTGVKHIYFTPYDEETNLPSTESSDKLELTSIIADTVAISQDDPESSETGCETRDEPIIESVTLGKYQITMDSADISYDILSTCMGFKKIGDGDGIAALAPASYVKKYVQVEVEMQDATFVAPRVLLTSKIDASSLKTGVAKGTLSGSAYSVKVKVAATSSALSSAAENETPFFVKDVTAVHSVTAVL